MEIVILLVFLNLNFAPSDQKVHTELPTFKERVQNFSQIVSTTKIKLEQMNTPSQPSCIATEHVLINARNKKATVASKFVRNTELLNAICAYTNDR